ncbi:gamma-glutamylputrescine oxidase [Amaricoccus macauensis]|uniref:Gamma-glutamylputrescine oxidase n=1 Tax=Amaricoccus macauensis TaxID=57001 RepID=A0A840SGE1_9RHOB|nr:FAD-binding oxidoreductase [Amaricoccus macauensis]MBB5222039.1 gamma-glutamylputrescine oxidase [Amaricoccus macauensis]
MDYPTSYYAASAVDAPLRPVFEGERAVEVCIVGAGFTGLSAAIELAERGHEVMVLEAAKVGWGASGRNGGQIVNGLNAGLDTIGRRYGRDTASFVATVVQEGGRIIRDRVARYGIACNLKEGNLFTAFTARQMRELEAKQALWRQHGIDNFELLDAAGVRRHVKSESYAGGMLDRTGGHLHPLNLALGEAAALEALGGSIHEESPVVRVEDVAGRPVVRTASGVVRPDVLILAGNAYLGEVVPEIADRVMPFSTQVMATEPLGERGRALLPTDVCVEDVRYVLDYYRLSGDGRMLWGGGTVYGGTDPADIRAKLVPNLERIFPELRGVQIDYAWSGNCAISFSRVPQMGRLGGRTYFAQGYSGHGVVGSHLFGRILGEAVDGDRSRFDVFERVPWIPFPGGRRFAVPYSVLGSWWYGLRDRLGV